MSEVRGARRGLKGTPARGLATDPALPSLAFDGRHYYTRDAGGGAAVYGEAFRRAHGATWRRFDARRSKFASALARGGLSPALRGLLGHPPLLYLGAASGTTASHLADLVAPGAVFAVEVAPRSFEELLVNLKTWKNVFPILGDARHPERYARLVGRAGGIVQDVAQADQVEILEANARAFLAKGAVAVLFLKARSVDSSADPERVFANARASLLRSGFTLQEERALEPSHRDHRAFVLRWSR